MTWPRSVLSAGPFYTASSSMGSGPCERPSRRSLVDIRWFYMFSFTGAWRAANEEEMCRLYTGHFPLRGTPFPTESDKAPERFG